MDMKLREKNGRSQCPRAKVQEGKGRHGSGVKGEREKKKKHGQLWDKRKKRVRGRK